MISSSSSWTTRSAARALGTCVGAATIIGTVDVTVDETVASLVLYSCRPCEEETDESRMAAIKPTLDCANLARLRQTVQLRGRVGERVALLVEAHGKGRDGFRQNTRVSTFLGELDAPFFFIRVRGGERVVESPRASLRRVFRRGRGVRGAPRRDELIP